MQPTNGCGDAYLSWDQVRALDRSGLITIGGHTVDHANLAGLSDHDQAAEILDSKVGIEQQLGHPIRHFAYPYGAYNDTSINLVRQAGYVTAVTTLPGSYQAPGYQYTLRRLRDAMELP
jgi:peptidoglycan/xylan/chitin deacetylase (PgdA/CDA1 family)